MSHGVTVDHLEPTQVLPGNLAVRADVDDVDALVGIPKMLNGLCDEAFGDHRLTQSDLVGDEESLNRIVLGPESFEGVLDRIALKVLEAGENLLRIGFHA